MIFENGSLGVELELDLAILEGEDYCVEPYDTVSTCPTRSGYTAYFAFGDPYCLWMHLLLRVWWIGR